MRNICYIYNGDPEMTHLLMALIKFKLTFEVPKPYTTFHAKITPRNNSSEIEVWPSNITGWRTFNFFTNTPQDLKGKEEGADEHLLFSTAVVKNSPSHRQSK